MNTETSAKLGSDQLRLIIETQSLLVSADFDLNSFMNILVERVQSLTCATGAVIELLEGDEMIYTAASGTVSPFVGLRLKAETSLSGLSVKTGEILRCDDTAADPRVDYEACKRVSAGSMIAVPLFRRNEAVGVLKVLARSAYAFDDHDVQTLQLMAGLLGGALGQQLEMDLRKQLEQKLQHLVAHDSLTGLPNRMLFNDRLAQAKTRLARTNTCFALMYMDIDHFKTVNDTLGHGVGDALLKCYSERVRGVVRASDTFARMGGDEFTLIAEELHTTQEALIIAEKIVQAIRTKFILGDQQEIQVSTSIGIALCSDANMDSLKLIRLADDALYKAKQAGRDCYQLYSP